MGKKFESSAFAFVCFEIKCKSRWFKLKPPKIISVQFHHFSFEKLSRKVKKSGGNELYGNLCCFQISKFSNIGSSVIKTGRIFCPTSTNFDVINLNYLNTNYFFLIPGILSVKIRQLTVPSTVEAGSENILLDCDFDYDADERVQLDIKWYFNNEPSPFYTWVPEKMSRPQIIGKNLWIKGLLKRLFFYFLDIIVSCNANWLMI